MIRDDNNGIATSGHEFKGVIGINLTNPDSWRALSLVGTEVLHHSQWGGSDAVFIFPNSDFIRVPSRSKAATFGWLIGFMLMPCKHDFVGPSGSDHIKGVDSSGSTGFAKKGWTIGDSVRVFFLRSLRRGK